MLAESPGCLALIDGDSAVAWRSLPAERPNTHDSLLVLCSRNVTPQLVQSALEFGMDGVLSTRLPVDEAAQALHAICDGGGSFAFNRRPCTACWRPPRWQARNSMRLGCSESDQWRS